MIILLMNQEFMVEREHREDNRKGNLGIIA
jgi:hypothetical protein